MVDHPSRRSAAPRWRPRSLSGHPAVLARLERARRTTPTSRSRRPRPPRASACATGRRRCASSYSGASAVRRAGWELDESSWKRPMAARVVRFLLVQGGAAVPEDALFEAFWADRPADNARQHLAVAVSRARKVLDLPGADAERDRRPRAHLSARLRERDSVDAVDFEAAATAALAEPGPGATRLARARRRAVDRRAAARGPLRGVVGRLARAPGRDLHPACSTRSGQAARPPATTHDAIRAARALLEVDPAQRARPPRS